jgi:hypothetical protein
MCGIVAYIGTQKAYPIILKGLLSTVISDIFKLFAYIYTKKAIETTDEGAKEILTQKVENHLPLLLNYIILHS